jgi:hypothetical protein
MKVSLKYQASNEAMPGAALLPGQDAELWFREMELWKIGWENLRCFALPKSRNDNGLAGLFVVFAEGVSPENIEVAQFYQKVEKALFIPLNAALYPPMTDEEIARFARWNVNVLHPSIGFVGFDKEDEIPPESLLIISRPVQGNWGKAKAGNPGSATLKELRMSIPAPDHVFQALKDEIQPKLLKK